MHLQIAINQPLQLVLQAAPAALQLVQACAQGLPGAQGPAGPAGLGVVRYEHAQAAASATWVVNHNFGFKPLVATLSVGGAAMLAEVIHASLNQAVIYFDAPVAGIAVCN